MVEAFWVRKFHAWGFTYDLLGPVEYSSYLAHKYPGQNRFQRLRGMGKKSVISPVQSQVRQEAPFTGQGRRHFDARSEYTVHEREGRQVCEPEFGNMGKTRLAASFNIPFY